MATELCTIKSTRTNHGIAKPANIPVPEIALTAFYGGTVDGPCLQLTLLGSRSYIELTRADVQDLVKELEQWDNTRFPEEVTYKPGCKDCGYQNGWHSPDCHLHSWNRA